MVPSGGGGTAAGRFAAALVLEGLLVGAASLGVDARQQLLSRSDGGVIGVVVHREVRAFEAPDGGELFFTTARVRGTDLATGVEETVDVTFPGGFISESRGAHSSTAPPANATRLVPAGEPLDGVDGAELRPRR